MSPQQKTGVEPPHSKKGKGSDSENRSLCELIPATTYVPTQLPVQYHRPGEA
jgi:hypothetical protein